MTELMASSAAPFIGLIWAPGDSTVDIAAEGGCVRLTQLPDISESPKPHRLPWFRVRESQAACQGAGGGATTVGVIEMPVVIAKLNGIRTRNVIDNS